MVSLQLACPCGTGTAYDACCGRLHRRAAEALTAEELMRSRYAAYAVGEHDHVFRTWHPSTRPVDLMASLAGEPTLTWTGLQILDVVAGGVEDEDGVVEFVASYTRPEGPGERRERSTFVRRRGRWVYVDGE